MAARVGSIARHGPWRPPPDWPRRLRSAWQGADVPISDARFWLVQALVLAIAGGHNVVEALGMAQHLGMLYFVPTSFYFMPVIYAAMYFGLRGSLPTAILCTVISIPNWLFWHEGFERFGDMAQMAVVVFFGLFVGFRINQERRLISTLEVVTRALELSESRYRKLFQSAGEAMLVLDDSGRVVECNDAARRLFWGPVGALRNASLDEMFSPEAARLIAAQAAAAGGRPPLVRIQAHDGLQVWVEPVCSRLGTTTQVVLRDVTQQRQRQADLETHMAHIHRAQEEERRRIAQEIHDETVQSLILLCRELDEVELPSVEGRGSEELDRVRLRAEEIIEGLRALIHDLRPPLLDDLGLPSAIQKLLDDVSSHSMIQMNLDVRGAAWRAPPSVELALLRIAQEAISNAVRHGVAAHVQVRLDYAPGMIALNIADDGRGFTPTVGESELVSQGHWGIAGMHERAREAGASLHIRSVPGTGTTVSARFGHVPAREGGLSVVP